MSVLRVAFFRNENSKAVLVKELVVSDADGNYPPWTPMKEFARQGPAEPSSDGRPVWTMADLRRAGDADSGVTEGDKKGPP